MEATKVGGLRTSRSGQRWAACLGRSVERLGVPGGGAHWVPAGLLDSDPGVRIAGHVFVGSKAPWDEIAGDAQQLVEGFGSE